MKIGFLVPQGYFNEFDGWEPERAWARVLHVTQLAEQLGFESIWTGEHVHSKWEGELVAFDCWTLSTALAAAVPRVAVGFSVVNSTFHNPALTAKRAGTLDMISGGRLLLGLGAGFKENEARHFGFAYPELPERLRILEEHVEIISRMTRRDEPPFTFAGEHAQVDDITNNPRTGHSSRDHIPIGIGGHGKRVTFRITARFADFLDLNVNLDEVPEYLEALAERCAEQDRDPAEILIQGGSNPSHAFPGLKTVGGQRMMTLDDIPTGVLSGNVLDVPPRPEYIARHRELGFGRFVAGIPGLMNTDEGIYEFLDDCRTAGIDVQPAAAAG